LWVGSPAIDVIGLEGAGPTRGPFAVTANVVVITGTRLGQTQHGGIPACGGIQTCGGSARLCSARLGHAGLLAGLWASCSVVLVLLTRTRPCSVGLGLLGSGAALLGHVGPWGWQPWGSCAAVRRGWHPMLVVAKWAERGRPREALIWGAGEGVVCGWGGRPMGDSPGQRGDHAMLRRQGAALLVHHYAFR